MPSALLHTLMQPAVPTNAPCWGSLGSDWGHWRAAHYESVAMSFKHTTTPDFG
jgi:hypothetical protein